jgi:hypothetical protein
MVAPKPLNQPDKPSSCSTSLSTDTIERSFFLEDEVVACIRVLALYDEFREKPTDAIIRHTHQAGKLDCEKKNALVLVHIV